MCFSQVEVKKINLNHSYEMNLNATKKKKKIVKSQNQQLLTFTLTFINNSQQVEATANIRQIKIPVLNKSLQRTNHITKSPLIRTFSCQLVGKNGTKALFQTQKTNKQ